MPQGDGSKWREYAFAAPGAAFGMLLVVRWGRQPDGGYFFTLFDDAAISKTYARTLAQTGELVWFPGADRVEGISNLLWTLVMAAVHFVGFSGSSAALVISVIGLLLLLVNAVQVGRLTARLLHGQDERAIRLGSSLAILVIGTAYPLIFWTIRGFETGLIALLYVLLLHRVLDIEDRPRGERGSAILVYALLSVGLALVRLDALVVPIAAAIWMLYRKLLTRTEFTQISAVVGSGIGLLFLWRFMYFGAFVPNTYFLKVSDAPTTFRLLRGLSVSGKLLPIVLLTLLALWADGRRIREQIVRPGRWQLPVFAFGGLVAYSIYVGGDAWEWNGFANRFVAPGLSIAVAVTSASLVTISKRITVTLPLPDFRLRILAAFCASTAFLAAMGGEVLALAVRVTPLDTIVENSLGYGRNAGPSDWAHWFTARFSIVLWLTFCISLAALIILLLARGRWEPAVAAASLLLAVSVWSALNPALTWDRAWSGVHVPSDSFMAGFGAEIFEATADDATVAIVWAGNLAYYSDRAVIDILGKSDPVIARMNPTIDTWRHLFPGHNKWDYRYSIGTLQPDLVAQTWMFTEKDRADFRAWGYEERCLGVNPVFVATRSERIDRERFRQPLGDSCQPDVTD